MRLASPWIAYLFKITDITCNVKPNNGVVKETIEIALTKEILTTLQHSSSLGLHLHQNFEKPYYVSKMFIDIKTIPTKSLILGFTLQCLIEANITI